MQFEDFDKKVKQAADHHHPPYDEQAWNKMEKLLNKHLPQKEDDRRRFIFFLLLFLGLGGAGLHIFKPWKKDKQPIATQQTAAQQGPAHSTASSSSIEPVTEKATTANEESYKIRVEENDTTTVNTVPVKNDPGDGKHVETKTVKTATVIPFQQDDKNNNADPLQFRKRNKAVTNSLSAKPNKEKTTATKNKPWWEENKNTSPDVTKKKTVVSEPVKTSEPSNKEIANNVEKKQNEKAEEKPMAENTVKPTETIADKTTEPSKKDEQPVGQQNNEKKQKNKTKKANSFFFTLSAGPDLSFVKNNKAGEVKLLTGAGIGYTFKDRVTVRTGFYAGRKVYSANPDAYDPPAAFYSLYPYLEKVDANCKVYEIPVSLSYNIGKKRNLFVSAGLSSFLMKEETYNYHYKYTPGGNTYTNKWTIKDKNSHFFSVATISAGYKKDISKRITLTAEPYIKMPVAGGVGYGKVKLNSGGVLFTVGIKPF